MFGNPDPPAPTAGVPPPPSFASIVNPNKPKTKSGYGSTILTSGQGVTDSAPTAKKSLLGA